MRGFRYFLVAFFLALSIAARVTYAHAQTQVVLGNASVELNGPWKFHIGDSPKADGSRTPLWAQPGFDDFGWQDYTIDPKHAALTAAQALQSAELPGWQQHGHPGYTGYAWYRVRLQTPKDAHSLALLMSQHVEDAYEVFVNGQKIGGLGKLDGFRTSYDGRAQVFSIPDALLYSSHSLTLAIRFWSFRYEGEPRLRNMAGGLRAAPLLGSHELLTVFLQSLHERTWKMSWVGLLLAALNGAVGIVSLFLVVSSRRQHEYLWAGICLIGQAVRTIAGPIAPLTNVPSQVQFIVFIVAGFFNLFALPMAAMYLLGVARPLWRRANFLIMAAIVGGQLVTLGLRLGLLPPTFASEFSGSWWSLFPFYAFFLLVLAIAVDGLRTIGRKAWLPLAPGVLFVCAVATVLKGSHNSGGFSVTNVLYASVPIAVLIVFLLRFTEQQREHVRLVDDMRQAQEVQHVLIPEALPVVPGFTLESEYRPAQHVGGDFFQIVPGKDGGILAVVGDVAGKGLKAAMLVSMIVGTIRTLAETTHEPLAILEGLNRRLCGRVKNQFATCVALHIAANGETTIANAGHLAPYLNGNEIAIAGSLPLGIVEAAEFEQTRLTLQPGDRITLISDGVVEATNDKRELFGFARTNELMRQDKSAVEIAAVAQAFGQEDDITVVGVTRTLEAIHAI